MKTVPYQKCPICLGTGTVWDNNTMSSSPTAQCHVCKGVGIIPEHVIKGAPPDTRPFKKRRKALGLSLKEVADKTGIDIAELSEHEKTGRTDIITAVKLSLFYDGEET